MTLTDIHRHVDASRFNRFHGLVLLWGILILVIDGYDLAVVGASTLGTQLIAYAGAYDPAAMRATGVGFASGLGRIGPIAAPVVIGWPVSLKLPLEQNSLAIGLAGLIGAVAMINHKRTASGQAAVDKPAERPPVRTTAAQA